MGRKFIFIILALASALSAFSQGQTISGSLRDGQNKLPLGYAVIQLLSNDSSYVGGTTSGDDGKFAVEAPHDGQYILKVSFVGMQTLCHNVSLSGEKGTDVGTLTLKADEHVLREVTVAALAPKVVLKNDTFQYNASAYRVPEGSTVEALVKVLPGAEVGDDGTVKINGKEVKKILVDGKEFMTGDTKTALKNLPTSIIEKVKAYDKQSDLSRVTGIDDGEEEMVLDFGVKKGMNRGFFSNIDLGIGTHGRYSERGMAAYFNDRLRVMGFASGNNVGDMGFGGGGRGGFSPMRQGLNSTKMAGLNLNYNNGKTLQWDGSMRWNHNDGDLSSRVSSENFVAAQRSYGNRKSQQYTRSNSWDGRFRLEWTPDTMWNIMFRPNLQLTKSDELTTSTSATFSEDPYALADGDPLSESALAELESAGALVNRQRSMTVSYGDNKTAGAMLQINRKLSANGRNVTLRMDGNYKDSDSKTFSTQDLQYFQLLDAMGQDSVYRAYRYNLMPTKSHGLSLEATYSEPIAHRTYLQLSYQYSYGFNKSERSTYDFSSLGADAFGQVVPAYRAWGSYLGLLTEPMEDYFDQRLSRHSEYKTYTHDVRLMFRTNQTKWRLNAGVLFQPQHSVYQQDYLGVHVDTVRNSFNWSPTLDFRYKFSKQSNLRINYRGTATQPTMSQLLDITDNTDPQNVSVGNPGLRPSFTNRFRLFYNGYRQRYTQAWMAYINFSSVRNAIGNSVTYDATSGARVVKPVNINGNWNADAAIMFNTNIDTLGTWNVNTFTTASLNRYASMLQQSPTSMTEKNITHQTTMGERIAFSYRNSWLEVSIDGSADYTRTKNKLQSAQNLNTWRFAYGGNINLTMPWGMSVSTDLHMNSRRGYNDSSLNTNELLWNAQVAQSFLKGKPLTISLQLYDILHQQSNLSRVINATGRTDTEYNSINSYMMVKATYRFNLFGGKPQQPKGDRTRDPDDRGPGMPPPPGGGHRPPMGGHPDRPF